MKKISNDNNFENYLNKYINVEVDGITKKFFVTEINANSFVTNAGILNNYITLGESSIQDCDVCEDPCFNNIPIIELNFRGGRLLNGETEFLLNDKYNETHDVFVNNNKICRIDTNTLSARGNRLWLIPFYSKNVQIPNFFDDVNESYSFTTAASCVFFDPLFYNKRNWNSLTIKPVSAYNPSTINIPQYFYTNFYGDVNGANYYRDESCVLSNKILVNSSNVSSVSCIPWEQYIFAPYNYSNFSCYPDSCPYLSTGLAFGTYSQQVTTFFIDLDPCQNPTEYGLGFIYDGTRYYADSTIPKEAYRGILPPDPYFGAPSLRKYIFYTDCEKSSTIELYNGNSNINSNTGPIWYSDLGLTPYNGFFYVEDDSGDVSEVEVVNGSEFSSNYCP